MSIVIMYKRCSRCRKEFAFNPSVGNMGLICSHCKTPQDLSINKLLTKHGKPPEGTLLPRRS